MAFGRFRRSTLGMILLISAFVPTATAAVATGSQKSPVIEYANTADCPGKQPTGLILYITTPADPSREPRELVVAEPNGKVVRKIDVRNPWWLFPADQQGKAIVYTIDESFFLVDATTGTVKRLAITGSNHVWPWGYFNGVPSNREWQLFYGEDYYSDYLLNLSSGNVERISKWLNPSHRERYKWAEIAPDDRHLVVVADEDLLIGKLDDLSSLRVVDNHVLFGHFYSLDGHNLYYFRYTEPFHYQLMSMDLNAEASRVILSQVRSISSQSEFEMLIT